MHLEERELRIDGEGQALFAREPAQGARILRARVSADAVREISCSGDATYAPEPTRSAHAGFAARLAEDRDSAALNSTDLEFQMNSTRLASLVLIVAGVLALAYGGFDYTRDTHQVDLGPLHVQVQERSHLNIPLWAGLACLLTGIVLLTVSARRAR